MSDLSQTLAWLVDVPSETGNEGRLATEIADRLLPTLGHGHVERVKSSIVAGARTGRPLVTLFGHIDTVPNQGQGQASVSDGRLHGLGSSDMKSGVAVMIHLLEDPKVQAGPYDVCGVFYAGEEGAMENNEMQDVLRTFPWLAESELAIVLEPTDLGLEVGCNGVVNARAGFVGRAAHSARPWLGENAVTKAAGWLAHMATLNPTTVEIGDLEYQEVVSITRAAAGVANNIIPARFECNVNFRFAPNRSEDEAREHLRSIIGQVDFFEVADSAPGAVLLEPNPLLDRLTEITGQPQRAKQGWTDVAQLTAHGIPAINYGPGEVAQAHQVGESVELRAVDAAFSALHSLLTTG